MKPTSNLLNRTFTVDPTAKHTPTFEEYVNKTAKLIKRPYFQTFKLVEDWEEHKIIRRYNEAKEKENPARYWFGMRKKDLSANPPY